MTIEKSSPRVLKPKTTYVGLEFLDAIVVTSIAYPIAFFCGFFFGVLIAAAIGLSLVIMKRGRLPNYSQDLLISRSCSPDNSVLGTDRAPLHPRAARAVQRRALQGMEKSG